MTHIHLDEETISRRLIAELPRPGGLLGRGTIGMMGNQWKPMNHFLVVIMANGIVRGRVLTAESRKMAASVQLIGKQRNTSLLYTVLF